MYMSQIISQIPTASSIFGSQIEVSFTVVLSCALYCRGITWSYILKKCFGILWIWNFTIQGVNSACFYVYYLWHYKVEFRFKSFPDLVNLVGPTYFSVVNASCESQLHLKSSIQSYEPISSHDYCQYLTWYNCNSQDFIKWSNTVGHAHSSLWASVKWVIFHVWGYIMVSWWYTFTKQHKTFTKRDRNMFK